MLVETATTAVIIDTTPDLREQCLDAGLTRLDAVLYTHEHADHVNGIDDLRAFRFIQGEPVPAYADQETMAGLERRFAYIFAGSDGYPAICTPHVIGGPLTIGDLPIQPFRQIHGNGETLGFRIGSFAYSTDLNGLPAAAKAQLRGLDLWLVDALRPAPHPTHTHLAQTLAWIEELAPKRALLTHMNWDMDYASLCAELPENVRPAHDGLVVELPDPA